MYSSRFLWIEHVLELEAGVEGDAAKNPNLPRLAPDLNAAVECMVQEGSMARLVLGDEFIDHYAATRRHEWEQWKVQVTDWEIKRYFEIV